MLSVCDSVTLTLSYPHTDPNGQRVLDAMHLLGLQLLSLLSYGIEWWLVFVAIAYCTARYGFWWCVPVGHLVTAGLILILDVNWAVEERKRPGWSEDPDLDIIFSYGVLYRAVLVNVLLQPVTLLAGMRRTAVPRKMPREFDILS